MRIVHFSDWHDETFPLPEADIYVCTGDMLPNFRTLVFERKGRAPVEWVHNMGLLGKATPMPSGSFRKLPPDHANEAHLQARLMKRRGHGYMRKKMASPKAPVVVVKGNHDFTDLAPLFAGGPVFEVSEDPTRWYGFEKDGRRLTFGGVRGVKTRSGKWADAVTHEGFAETALRLPLDIDVLVTHGPPQGVLDFANGEATGIPALRAYAARRDALLRSPKRHLFGHIHEARGVRILGQTLFSNAACGWHVIEI